MADETTPETTAPAEAAPAGETNTVPDAVIGLVTDGAYTLIIAQFKNDADTEAAYAALEELEQTTSLRIDGVMTAKMDESGKVSLGRMTDHSTKTGLKWGVVGGVVAGILFPPTILASAASLGVVGAVLGKVRNKGHRSDLTAQLQEVMTPGTSGIVALVEDTAVVAVREALVKADKIVTDAVDKEVAKEIDRQAAAAKAEIGA